MVLTITNVIVKYIETLTISGEIFYKFKILFDFTGATKLSGTVYGPSCNILQNFTNITIGSITIQTKHFGIHKIKVKNGDNNCDTKKLKIKIKSLDGETSSDSEEESCNSNNCCINNLEEYIVNICTNICEEYCKENCGNGNGNENCDEYGNLLECDDNSCPYCNP